MLEFLTQNWHFFALVFAGFLWGTRLEGKVFYNTRIIKLLEQGIPTLKDDISQIKAILATLEERTKWLQREEK